MAEARIENIVDRLRRNLQGLDIELPESDIQAMAEGGLLKPILAFEEATRGLSAKSLPAYLSSGSHCEEEDHSPPSPAGSLPRSRPSPKIDLGSAGPAGAPAYALSELLASGEVSPRELVEEALARVEEGDRSLNVFQLRLDEEAREAALAAEKEIGAGRRRGALHGIPVAVKDNLDMAGKPTRAGSIILGEKAAISDSTAVARLRAAGAIILGKTRMSEFAYSPGSNNDHYGPTRNPRCPACDAGGSSSGSAAAVSSGMAPLALGTDTGGSIRIPASFCGIVGLKPSFGALSLQGAVSLSWSLDHLGFLARYVKDVALLMDALAGLDTLDARTMTRPRTEPPLFPGLAALEGRGLRGLRVGILRDDGSGRALASEEILSAWKSGLAALEAQGASLVEIDLPELQALRTLNGSVLAMEAAAFHLPMIRSRLADYGDFTRLRLLAGLGYGPVDFIKAQQWRSLVGGSCGAIFKRVDILTMPTMSAPAPALGSPPRLTFTAPFNTLGWPAISIPAARSKEGLPIGIQLVAKPWDEVGLLRAALVAEAGLAFH